LSGQGSSSIRFHNKVVDQIRDISWDISVFASRWVERAWEIALNLHSAEHGTDCYKMALSAKTFSDAILITESFSKHQIDALQLERIRAVNEFIARLEEIFHRNGKAPITLRDLSRRHGFKSEEVLKSVKSHPETFGAAIAHRSAGGPPSTIIFLKTNPPPGFDPAISK